MLKRRRFDAMEILSSPFNNSESFLCLQSQVWNNTFSCLQMLRFAFYCLVRCLFYTFEKLKILLTTIVNINWFVRPFYMFLIQPISRMIINNKFTTVFDIVLYIFIQLFEEGKYHEVWGFYILVGGTFATFYNVQTTFIAPRRQATFSYVIVVYLNQSSALLVEVGRSTRVVRVMCRPLSARQR